MLPDRHPHAWNVDHADDHLAGSFRRRWMVTGSRLVITPQMRQLVTTMPTALDSCTAIAISGPYGSGKSTVLAALCAVADVNTAVVDLNKANSDKAQWAQITQALTGQTLAGSARDLQNTALEYLHAVPTVLVVDEAQHLRRSALLQLRWLWDHPFPRFALVLAGSNLFDRLQTEESVNSRIGRRIALRHHTAARMLDMLHAHHPQVAATDPALLAQVDDVYAHGSWRAWSHLLSRITDDMGHTGPYTLEVLTAAVTDITGFPPALKPAGAHQTTRSGATTINGPGTVRAR